MSDLIKYRINALQSRSKAKILKELMPEIDKKVSEGVPHGDIIKALGEEGLSVSMATFRTNLYRYRREIKNGAPVPLKQTQQQAVIIPAYESDDEFEAALDPSRRNEFAGQYINSRRPILGKKKQRTEDS